MHESSPFTIGLIVFLKLFTTSAVILDKERNMPELPRISLVIPNLNCAKFIERTIRSVLDQNYPNLELILSDGGSTDGSLEIIENTGQTSRTSSQNRIPVRPMR